ncbi:prolipoprotein diacylglyceryl transferase [Rhodopirellula maiorica SM1]|uniref:Phosphatidylglycerol--prolipoprotein diacylglyceryl transferase n=1 Tax=Rhodopirellula maiorica SM1 TaxID=1265738 RepID=M5S7N6_9BACT|nr:prolipoprotein diacylglyceryl transferase family protein [Rhodopirellula maiorica]EMI22189.1 prolipoprotein diacylglyceryl transferase [Rhodopirellula maiorica SM1]
MRRTLILIPHEIAGLPIFGFGWVLILLGLALVIRAVMVKRHGGAVGSFLATEGLMWGLFAAAVAFILPSVELKNVDGEAVGMAIRGYGVMLLLGVLSAVGLAMVRAKRRGINPDVVLNMAPWVFIGGIGGARLFYVVQYHDHFMADSFVETVRRMLTFTEGGLVVYGSFIGGFLAGSFYIARHKLPLLKLGDAIVPCMFLGLFFGRIGCLMNGCCYGGQCEDYWAALRFPPGSPVYQDQALQGDLIGLRFDPTTGEVSDVASDSLAEFAGIKVGSIVEQIRLDDRYQDGFSKDLPREQSPRGVVAMIDGKIYRWTPQQLPQHAVPVQPAQLISSVSGLSVCLLLCALSLVLRRDGAIMLLGFAAYAVMRFVLEMIRVDEQGQFGTNLSISQWVSIGVLLCTIVAAIWLYSRKPSDAGHSIAEPT